MPRIRPLHDLALAFALLTTVPIRAQWPKDERTHAADYFVVVGVALGAVAAGLAVLLSAAGPIEVNAALLGGITVLAWALLTRGLHWDGLADVADAWTVVPERRDEVMHDSRVGAFGVLAIVGVFALQVLSIATVVAVDAPQLLLAVACAPLFGRLAASFGCWLGEAASPTGLGASVMGRPSVVGVGFSAVVVVGVSGAAVWASPLLGAIVIGVGLLGALAVPHLLAGHMGGVNGDVLGASVLVVETVVLLAAAVASGPVGAVSQNVLGGLW